ncbi:SDR family oxidoreductase [uncultured Chitinophaga sp.]|jgi:Short-chain dehydrogenases of various substrate specificities|uniref:SDR family oxidoreductase n=1 Tax=uncultured Chitinophaga sp. TaxID=339340 RepID=UPI0026086E2E|nr:SDR family oxidoreductase [uncultured Chitinophaga sp.]
MNNSIPGKVVVITGASSGAGRCTALELARNGACVVLASRNEQALRQVADECRDLGAEALVVPTDVTDYAAMQQLAVTSFAWKSRIDVWFNNAGVLAAGPFEQTPWAIHEKVISTNLLGYMRGAYAVLPYFKQQKTGTLINNISIGGYVPVPFGEAYSASKFALRGFFEALKGELTGWPRIHVVDLFPPFLDTPGILHAGNYTGKVLKPAPPVYDPMIVANAVKASILRPMPVRYPGGAAAILFRLGHSLAPETMMKLTGLLMKGYFKVARTAADTDGNLFSTVHYAMGVRQNSPARIRPGASRILNIAAAAAVTGLTVLFLRKQLRHPGK